MNLKFIDLFAGVGGFHYGINQVSVRNWQTSHTITETSVESMESTTKGNKSTGDSSNNISSRDSGQISYTCVYSNEWNKYANSVYRKHYGECDSRDIRTVPTSEIPDHDLLCGGFPCQAFSVAGKRGGFNDTRGTMFFEIARILKDKRPRYLLLENVKGLLSHDSGKTFQTILGVLSDLGYDVQWQVLNSKNFGIPQNRERVYIVGHLRGTPRPQVFPIAKSNGKTLKELTKGQSQAMRVYQPILSNTIASQAGGLGAKTGLYAIPVLTPDRIEKRQNGRRFKNDGEPAFTLTGQDRHGVYDGVKIRRLTPVECERLQGFTDQYTKYGAGSELISDTQRYMMMGNAVTTNVVTAIVERMFNEN